MGLDWYLYDPLGRLAESSQRAADGQTYTGSYGYDRFGSLLTMNTTLGNRSFGVDSSTNRLTTASYDASGAVTSWAGQTFERDPFDMIRASEDWIYIYGPGDERLWTIHAPAPSGSTWTETFTLRGLGAEVLREYQLVGGTVSGTWTVERDTVHRDGRVLAVVTPSETQHASLDHLGTPRLWTGPGGVVRRRPEHLPYGEPAVSSHQKLQFTGHERDERGSGATDDLDYMHARYYSPHLGRFLSLDPATSVSPGQPQFWNRYAYVSNSPLSHIDPDGEALETVLDVVGVGYDIVELVREPSWKNAGILVLDIGLTAVSFVPSIGGSKLAVNAVRRGVGGASELARFSELARSARVTDEFLSNKVLCLHGPSALNVTRNKFISGFDIKAGIEQTLTNSNTLILQNTEGRAGAILLLDFGQTIGRNKKGKELTRLKVVLDGEGNLVTAFPVR